MLQDMIIKTHNIPVMIQNWKKCNLLQVNGTVDVDGDLQCHLRHHHCQLGSHALSLLCID